MHYNLHRRYLNFASALSVKQNRRRRNMGHTAQNEVKVSDRKKEVVIAPELHSQFIEFLGSCIYDGIWVGEDSDIPNYKGIRRDVVDALKEIEPPVMRWPGGCFADTYHWKNGIGKREDRPVTYNENFGTFEVDHNQFGTHEFMEFCEMLGAKPWLGVNVLSGSVGEMRDWVEYCNRSEETDLSNLRKENGHKEPFGVEYWGIGNEAWAGGGTMTPELYAQEYRKYSSAMPRCDFRNAKPGEGLKLIACGPDGNKPKERVRWTRDFFAALAHYRQPQIDAMDLHFYNWNMEQGDWSDVEFDEAAWDRVIESCFELEDVIEEQYDLIQEGLASFPEEEGFFATGAPHCDLIVGEWGNWHGSSFLARPALYQQCTMRDAITTALTLDIFHRNCDKVKMACVAQTVNVLNALILTEKEHTVLTPNYDVFLMYKVHRGARPMKLKKKDLDPKIHLFASCKGDEIYVNVVNADCKRAKDVTLHFEEDMETVSTETLRGDSITDYNSVECPDKVRRKAGSLPEYGKDGFVFHAEAASVNVLKFRKK